MKKFHRPHQKQQKILGLIFIAILIIGFFYPYIGFSILTCMFAGLLIAIKNGRKWCDWWCPRGSFLDEYIAHISPQKPLPKWFFQYKIRISFIVILFSFLLFNIYLAWPNLENIAFAFVKTLIITTIFSIILAIFLRARVWCVLCPVGTFSGLIGGQKNSLKIDNTKCTSCTICQQVCPLSLAPYQDRELGKLKSKDCLKCNTCVVNCPKKALCFLKK
jgi:ferredoxin-type protein NapH